MLRRKAAIVSHQKPLSSPAAIRARPVGSLGYIRCLPDPELPPSPTVAERQPA